MKRVLAILLVVLLIVSLVGCKNKEDIALEKAREAAEMKKAAEESSPNNDNKVSADEDNSLYPHTMFKRLESIIVPNKKNAVAIDGKGFYTLTWTEHTVGDVGLYYKYSFEKGNEEYGSAPADEYFWQYLYANFENKYESMEWCGDIALINGEYGECITFYDGLGNKMAYTHSENNYEVTYELFILYSEPHKGSEKNTSNNSENVSGDVTTGMKNALQSAKNYLAVMPFSYTGLIGQLEFEGYSNTEAVYAVDNCGADWDEQAVRCAQNYLDIMPFSRKGLIEQLEFDGFTYEQAVYGVDQVY